MEEEKTIEFHFRQALSHLESALNQSIRQVLENQREKEAIGKKWELFLGEFLRLIREKGKQSRLNLLSWITFPRIGK